MMKDLELSSILTLLIGGVVGLFPILLNAILSWSDKRSRASRQHKALELAKSRIDFIEKWVKVQQDLNSSERFEEIKQETSNELSQIKVDLYEVLVDEEEDIEANERNLFQRIFLLYRPQNFYGWVTHIVFYAALFYTVTIIIDYQPGYLDNIFSWDQFFPDLIFVFIISIPTIIVRAIARRIERKATEKSKAIKSS